MSDDQQEKMPVLVSGELITDRHIATAAQDRLQHGSVAEEVAQLVMSVDMPCNVALYAPWGAGKSGLARLIGERLRTMEANAEFVVFDASKYAGASLRRHFISQIATSLKIKDKRFGSGLYRETTRTDIDLEARTALGVIGFLLLILAVAAAVATTIAYMVALLAKGPTGDRFNEFIRPALAFMTAPAALALGIIAFAGKTIPVTRRISAPSSEEEFERLFRKLRAKVSAQRLVVFIDELDRCAAKDVVATLETVRTFLGVDGCVFVVAADQQVLERALQTESKQASPVDVVNPYYSSGSEYLDKTFQHQLHLPPLRSRRLTQFALDLTAGLPGVWSQVDRSELLPVLVPTHVQSPRRVKALLNTYATTYRIARRRLGDVDSQTALQLAKLVCLRCEFPLFVASLTRDPRLPELVLAARDQQREREEGGDDEPDETQQLAQLYASGEEPVDDLMLDSSDAAAAERTEVTHAQAQQLVAYLQKTEHVPNPTRELIHMESSGALTGLNSTLADRLEELAANGQDLDAAALVSELARPDDQLAALRHLAQVTRELPPGPEGRNGVKCLVAAFSRVPDIDLGDHASEIAAAVSSHLGRYELRRQDLAGAFLLGMRTPLGGADELVAQVLERDELVSDNHLARVVTRHMDRLLPEHAQRLGLMIAAAAARGDEGIANHLAALPDEVLSPLLSGVRSALPDLLELSAEEVAAEAEDGGGSAPFPQPAAARESLGELARLLVEGNRDAPAQIALVVLLALNTKEARNASLPLLPKLEPIPPGELANAVLDAVARRAVSDWPNWLQPLAKGLGEDSDARTELAQLALELWRKSSAGDTPTPAEARDAGLTALARLGVHTGEDLTAAAQQATSASPQNEPSAAAMTLALSTAEAFDQHGLLDFDALCPAASAALQAALPVGLPPQPATSTMVSLIVDWLPALAIHLDSAGRDALQAALVASPWMPTAENQATRLHIAAVAAEAGDAGPCPLDTTQIVAHMQSQPDLFAAPASAWLRHIATAADITEMLVALGSAAPDMITTALTDRAAVDPETAWRIAETLVSSTGERAPRRQIIRALGVTAHDPGRVAQMLVDRYEAAGNNQEREAVLDTWRALEISDDSARKQLILNVLLPMAHSSKGGLEAVNKHLDLAKAPPHGTLMRLREDLLKRGKAAGIEGQTRKALEKQGLIEPKKGLGGFFGRR